MRDQISIPRAASLHPLIAKLTADTIDLAEAELSDLYAVRIVQAGRSIKYQDELYNQPHDGKDNDGDGRIDEPDEHVTAAKGGQSYHNYYLAIDICILFKDPATGVYKYDKVKSWIVDQVYFTVVNLFKSAGFEWGGDWTPGKRDKPHLQKRFGWRWQELLPMYQAGKLIPGTDFVDIVPK